MIEDEVCELELAERLKELGVKQSYYWCWWKCKNGKYELGTTIQAPINFDDKKRISIPAFAVGECLKIYGEEIIIPKGLTNIANFIAKKILIKMKEEEK